MKLHSGNHILIFDGVEERIEKAVFWQSTVVYFELSSDKEIDSDEVLEYRTNVVSEFSEEFLETDDVDDLW